MSFESAQKVLEAPVTGEPSTEIEKPLIPPAAEPKEVVDARRFAAIAKRERAMAKQREELSGWRKEQEAWKAEREAWNKQKQEEETLWNRDPFSLLQKRGYDYNKLTQIKLNEGAPSPEMVAKQAALEELENFKKEQATQRDAEAKAQAKRQQDEFNNTITNWKNGIKEFATTNADEYGYINLYEEAGFPAHELVAQVINQRFEETQTADGVGKVMSNKEGCDAVEKWLEEQDQKGRKKFKKFLPKGEEKAVEPPPVANQSKTITNSMSSSAPSMLPAKTEQDRLQRAMKALESSK